MRFQITFIKYEWGERYIQLLFLFAYFLHTLLTASSFACNGNDQFHDVSILSLSLLINIEENTSTNLSLISEIKNVPQTTNSDNLCVVTKSKCLLDDHQNTAN